MIKTKTKIFRLLTGVVLVVAFPVKLIMMETGVFLISEVKAELFKKEAKSDFRYQADSLENFKRINLPSFFGKPVKIPLESANPEQAPGGDRDYIIIYPPRALNKNTSIPLRAIYFSSGKNIDEESAGYVRNIEAYVNSVANNNPAALEIIKNFLQSDLRLSIKDSGSLLSLLISYAKAQDESSTDLNPLLSGSSGEDLASQIENLDTADPEVKQLLTLVLLLILTNQSLAESLNKDKEDCLQMGGEWMNNECLSEEKTTCEDNDGNFRLFENQCLADQQKCGNEDLQCDDSGTGIDDNSSYTDYSDFSAYSDYNDNTNNNEDLSVYSCACKKDQCLNDDGICVDKENGKQKICENSGGRWRNFFSSSDLCLQKCGITETECNNVWGNVWDSGANSSFGINASSYDARSSAYDATSSYGNSASDSSDESGNLMGCDCSPNCVTPNGDCIKKDATKLDDDKDGVPNGQDRCPGTPEGDAANNVVGSPDQGCSCNQLMNMGRLRPPQCPPDTCDGRYAVKYDRSSNNNPAALCQNGVIQQQPYSSGIMNSGSTLGTTSMVSCPVISRMPSPECDNTNANSNNNNNNNSLEDLLRRLLDNKNNNNNRNNNNNKDKQNNNKNKDDNGGKGGEGGKGGTGGDPGKNGNDKNDKSSNNQNANNNSSPVTASPANDPKGVGEANAKQNGTQAAPYYLHTSQFKKICGENTYVLTNAAPGVGDFKNNPSAKPTPPTPATGATKTRVQGTSPLPDLNKLDSVPCPPGVSGCPNNKDRVKKLVGDNWNRLDQASQDRVIKYLQGHMDQNTVNNINSTVLNGLKESVVPPAKPQPTPTSGTSNTHGGAKTMKDLNEPGAYFKIPKCEELAECHCCVCSCCDKGKKDCGWSLGNSCKDGKCQGQNCDTESCGKCNEDATKSIQLLTGGNTIPANLKQTDNKCYEIDHNKETTSGKLCENYNEPVHKGACRYDCKGETKGCEEGSTGCRIIIEGKEIQRFTLKGSTMAPSPVSDAQYIEFDNQDGGSLVQTIGEKQPSATDWIKNLADEKGKCCKCQARSDKKNPAKTPNGYNEDLTPIPPTPQPTPTLPSSPSTGSYVGDRNEDWDWTTDNKKKEEPASPSFPENLTGPEPSKQTGALPGQPDKWPEPIVDKTGENFSPTAPTVTPATPAQQGVWQSFKNLIRAFWEWGSFKQDLE